MVGGDSTSINYSLVMAYRLISLSLPRSNKRYPVEKRPILHISDQTLSNCFKKYEPRGECGVWLCVFFFFFIGRLKWSGAGLQVCQAMHKRLRKANIHLKIWSLRSILCLPWKKTTFLCLMEDCAPVKNHKLKLSFFMWSELFFHNDNNDGWLPRSSILSLCWMSFICTTTL